MTTERVTRYRPAIEGWEAPPADPWARRMFEPVPAPYDLRCDGCHTFPAYVIWIWKLEDWRCCACADGGSRES